MQSAFCRLLSLLCLCLLSGAVRAELPLLDLRRADVDTVPAVRLLEDASGQLSLYQARGRLLSEGTELRGVPSLGATCMRKPGAALTSQIAPPMFL